MNAQKERSNGAKNSNALQMVVLNDHRFAVEERYGNISFNLTQMAKPYGESKKPTKWLRTDASRYYLEALSLEQICPTADNQVVTSDLVEVVQGGTPERQGTWAHHHLVALEFARWLDPKFAIQVNLLVWQILTDQVTVAEPFMGVNPVVTDNKSWYCYLDVLKKIGYSTSSGSVATRKLRYSKHFNKFFGRNFVSLEFCYFLKKSKELHRMQLGLSSEANRISNYDKAFIDDALSTIHQLEQNA